LGFILELLAFSGYALASVAYLVFVFLLLAARNNTLLGRFVLLASMATLLTLCAATAQYYFNFSLKYVLVFETFKLAFWALLITSTNGDIQSLKVFIADKKIQKYLVIWTSISAFFWLSSLYSLQGNKHLFVLFLILNLWVLVMLEQLYRSANAKARWALWPLVIALGVICVFDFILYAQATMLNQLNFDLWALRAFAATLAVPFILISTKRMKDWSVNVFISRGVVFYSSMLMIAGLYLLVMATVGYVINYIGGEWGSFISIAFVMLGGVVLVVLLITESLRRRVKVFIAKHFFANKYEYREEWLDLIEKIETTSAESYYQMATHIMMSKLDVDAGAIVKKFAGMPPKIEYIEGMSIDDKLNEQLLNICYFCQNQGWIFDVQEYIKSPDFYQGLSLDLSVCQDNNIRIVVPIFIGKAFYGLFVLAGENESTQLNWEDRDLLFAISKQLGNFISLHEANDKLAESKQFDAFNRMSAFLVHDLKNIQAQLALITVNAEKHAKNPEFIEDVFETVESATARLDKVLSQLRNKQVAQSKSKAIELSNLIEKVATQCNIRKPQVVFESSCECEMNIDDETLFSILNHLIQNAQEATKDDGYVKVFLHVNEESVKIIISDNGVGMSKSFIKQRLYKPFDTTKGNAGMGIGVYEAKQFIESIAGVIDVDSIEGQGTNFTITLPMNPVFDTNK